MSHRHIFLLHVYKSVSLARMRRYMQLAYLFHQCAKSFLSRDSHIAGCTVRHPGLERPFLVMENGQRVKLTRMSVSSIAAVTHIR